MCVVRYSDVTITGSVYGRVLRKILMWLVDFLCDLWVIRAGVRSPAGPKDFSLQQNIETESGLHSAPIKRGT